MGRRWIRAYAFAIRGLVPETRHFSPCGQAVAFPDGKRALETKEVASDGETHDGS